MDLEYHETILASSWMRDVSPARMFTVQYGIRLLLSISLMYPKYP